MNFKLRINARYFSEEELLADLRQAARTLRRETIGEREYVKAGKFSCKPFINRFGSWNNALKKAGLQVVRETKTSDETLFENLERIWLKLGRQPSYSEIRRPFSKFGIDTYTRKFGGWMKTCEAFIRHKRGDLEFQKLFKEKGTAKSRNINERDRLRIYKRDNYACVLCGKSPATHRGITLHLDHITPFEKSRDNSPQNLRTLCNKCNLGRGNDESL